MFRIHYHHSTASGPPLLKERLLNNSQSKGSHRGELSAMPTEGGSCLFSVLKWATNDRPYVVNVRPMIAPTPLMCDR